MNKRVELVASLQQVVVSMEGIDFFLGQTNASTRHRCLSKACTGTRCSTRVATMDHQGIVTVGDNVIFLCQLAPRISKRIVCESKELRSRQEVVCTKEPLGIPAAEGRNDIGAVGFKKGVLGPKHRPRVLLGHCICKAAVRTLEHGICYSMHKPEHGRPCPRARIELLQEVLGKCLVSTKRPGQDGINCSVSHQSPVFPREQGRHG